MDAVGEGVGEGEHADEGGSRWQNFALADAGGGRGDERDGGDGDGSVECLHQRPKRGRLTWLALAYHRTPDTNYDLLGASEHLRVRLHHCIQTTLLGWMSQMRLPPSCDCSC